MSDAKTRRGTPTWLPIVILAALVLGVFVMFALYLYWSGVQSGMAERCEALGAVAVQASGSGDVVCVEEVLP